MESKDYFAKRFSNFFDTSGETQDFLANKFSVTRQAVASWKKGVIPRGPILAGIAMHYDTTVDYLLGVTDDPIPPQLSTSKNKKTPEQLLEEYKYFPDEMPIWLKAYQMHQGEPDIKIPEGSLPYIPTRTISIMGSVKCGPDGIAFEEPLGEISVTGLPNGDLIALRCKGDSMTGLGIFDGDIAIVRKQSAVESGELAVIIINGDEGTLKRVYFKGSMAILESANPSYPQRFIEGEELKDFHIVGRVMQIIKRY